MKFIYEPKGAAAEYSPLACNPYRGCTHRCRYCYVPPILRTSPDEFHGQVVERPGVRDGVLRDLKSLALVCDKRRVLLSFTCDPFPEIEAETHLTEDILDLHRLHNQPAAVLTKAGARSRVALPILAQMDGHYGISLAWGRHGDAWRRWEPGAAPPEERVVVAREAAAMGIPVFVSVEPVVDEIEGLSAISWAMEFATDIRVGKLNHQNPPRPVNWTRFAGMAQARLRTWGLLAPEGTRRRWMLKESLAGLVDGPTKGGWTE